MNPIGSPLPGARLAIVGTGVSGLVAAHHLHDRYDLSIFEANSYIGGHTNTLDVEWAGEQYNVDTGFIVFNDWTYQNFIGLLDELGVDSQPSDMGFSVHCDQTGIEYCGSNLDAIFAQRRNALRPSFLWMLREIMRFNKEATASLQDEDDGRTLGEFLDHGRYSQRFIDHYIIPMGAAIWSASPAGMRAFPARYFIRFFHNHGMLSVDERPQWRVVKGGSREYVRALTRPFADRIALNSPVRAIHRRADKVTLEFVDGRREDFAGVIMATHSDQALRLLAQPTAEESQILAAIPYQDNDAVLHVDDRAMPKSRKAWAAWNYHIPTTATERVSVTYNMNILQSIEAPVQFCVTLNSNREIPAEKVIREIRYQHPIFNVESVAAQARHHEISGHNRTWFCGAYWGFGFHEDGVKSGLAVVDQFQARSATKAS